MSANPNDQPHAHDPHGSADGRRADAGNRVTRRPTIEDVARLAEVSVATVSRALRGLPNVAESTRARVAAAAESLKYRPDPAASRLAARKTKTITVGVPSVSGWYFSTVVAGAEAVCNEADYEFQVIAIGSLADRDRLLDDDHHLERRTDGLILVEIEPSPRQAAALAGRDIALATIGHALDGHPAVRIDDHRVGALAAEHLVSLGHRRVGMIAGLEDDPMNFVVPRARHAGFAATLSSHGVELDGETVIGGNFSLDGGREAMSALLDLSDPPTAVFAMSDDMAFGALMAADEAGLSVPDDVSIIGVDDHEFARVVHLTTIRQPVADHGAHAARMLIDTMTKSSGTNGNGTNGAPASDGDEFSSTGAAPWIAPEVELVVRGTTAPP